MPRIASWTEVRDRYQAWVKRDTFEVIEHIANAHFARAQQLPARVEIELEVGSEYDDEGGAFTTVAVKTFVVQNAEGTVLQPFEPGTDAPLEPDAFHDELLEKLLGLEWDIRAHFETSSDRCVINLLNPPPAPPSLLISEEGPVNE